MAFLPASACLDGGRTGCALPRRLLLLLSAHAHERLTVGQRPSPQQLHGANQITLIPRVSQHPAVRRHREAANTQRHRGGYMRGRVQQPWTGTTWVYNQIPGTILSRTTSVYSAYFDEVLLY